MQARITDEQAVWNNVEDALEKFKESVASYEVSTATMAEFEKFFVVGPSGGGVSKGGCNSCKLIEDGIKKGHLRRL